VGLAPFPLTVGPIAAYHGGTFLRSRPRAPTAARRGYSHANLDNLTAMIYLCLGGVALTLPASRSF
jgi:hypothetical protein